MKICRESKERRTQLIDAAELLFFHEKDYQSTTVNDIIERVGLAKGTFYHYFRSKNDLLSEVLERKLDEFVRDVESLTNDRRLGTMEKLERIIELIFRSRASNIPKGDELLVNQSKAIRENFIIIGIERSMPQLSKILNEGIEDGLFNTHYPVEALHFILSGSKVFADSLDVGGSPAKMESLGDFIERILGAEPDSFKRILRERTLSAGQH